MHHLPAPDPNLDIFRLRLERLLQTRLCFIEHILFPGCIYITDADHNNDIEEENFYLIYELKKDPKGLPQAYIHFFQIPLHLRNKGMGRRVYQLVEEVVRNQGCKSIALEARVNSSNPRDNTVGFWGRQGFFSYVSYAFDDENYPMIKRFV